jgi:hypothetical protein
MDRRVFVGFATVGLVGFAIDVPAQGGPPGGSRPRWGEDVEKEFRVGRGMGPKLMSEAEWKGAGK